MHDKLTKNQLQAVTYKDKHLMIVAGAGTGKTTVITSRIAWLIEQGIAPENILALTFTEKAANEMQERVDQLLPYGVFGTTICTFHSLGQQILQKYGAYCGIDDQTKLVADIEQHLLIKKHILDFPISKLRPLSNPYTSIEPMLRFFSRCKDNLITPEKLVKFDQLGQFDNKEEFLELASAYEFYQKLLAEKNLIDFGELQLRFYQLLTSHKDVLGELQAAYKHILVDEYQDTNYAQIELLKLLVGKAGHLTVVGDDDQSIYRFRGALVGQMEQFKDEFKGCNIITLTDNFRSTQAILDNAYELIQKNNPYRLEASEGISKKLTSCKLQAKNSKLQVNAFPNDFVEAKWITEDIIMRVKSGALLENHCILTRTNQQARVFAELLKEMNVQFTTKANGSIGDDSLVKLIFQFLNVVTNPKDFLSLFFLATSPIYNIPSEKLILLVSEAKDTHQNLETLMENDTNLLSETVNELFKDIAKSRAVLHTAKTTDIILNYLKTRDILQKAAVLYLDDELKTHNGVTKLLKTLQQYEAITSDHTVLHFMQDKDLLLSDATNGDDEFGGGGVRLLTVHQAKGLEFATVYITNLIEGRFPSIEKKSGFEIPSELLAAKPIEGEQVREERRLMYVAITRAKQELILSYARRYGSGVRDRKPSRFISEIIKPEIIEIDDQLDITKPARSQHPYFKTTDFSYELKKLNPHTFADYSDCPFRYKLANIDKIPQPDSPALAIGRAMHLTFADYFTKRINDNEKVSVENLINTLKTNWVSRGFDSKELDDARLAEAIEQTKNFYQFFEDFPLPKVVERDFKVKIDNIALTGRMDAVFPPQNVGAAFILDFKTTSSVSTQAEADKFAKKLDQLLLYAYAWQKESGNMPETGLYFPNSNLISYRKINQKDLDRIEDKLVSAIDKIRTGDFTATPSQFVCNHCPYKDICPYSVG